MEELNDVEGDNVNDLLKPIVVPKKRGRPVKLNKILKVPSGRGRGRPAKTVKPVNVKSTVKVDISDDEIDGKYSPLVVGSATTRGRPQKSGSTYTIVATGRGRGRPKKINKAEDETDEDNVKFSKIIPRKVSGQRRGRPRKVQNSDDERSEGNNDYEEERRSVGRPRTGGLNLNIKRTGRGQGRPKKQKTETVIKDNGSVVVPKKRGRPAASTKEDIKKNTTDNRIKCGSEMANLLDDDNEISASESDEKNNGVRIPKSQ